MPKEWWQEGIDEDAIDDAEKQNARRFGPGRFWMEAKTRREIIFVDDGGVSFWEHQYYANGHFRNYTPCLLKNKKMDEDQCPLCAAGNHPYFVGHFSVVDLNEWKDKKGVVHKNEVKLYSAKTDVLRKIQRRKAKKVSLVGIKFEVSRGGKQDFSTGSDFDIVEENVNIAKLYPEAKPIDYKSTILVPMSVADMTAIVKAGGGNRNAGGGGSRSGGGDDEDEAQF